MDYFKLIMDAEEFKKFADGAVSEQRQIQEILGGKRGPVYGKTTELSVPPPTMTITHKDGKVQHLSPEETAHIQEVEYDYEPEEGDG